MVYKRKKHVKSIFRKVPMGGLYWLASDLTTAPLVKVGRHAKGGAFSTDRITQTAVADATVAVVRVPQVFAKPVLGQ